MTRTRLVLCLALIGAMGACGGRSGLHPLFGDGSSEAEDGSADGRLDSGRQDSRLDGGLGSDTRIEVGISDARTDAGISDARAEAGTSDVRVVDVAPDVRAEAGGLDSDRDVALAEVGRPEVGRSEVLPPPTDGPRDAPVDAAPTLTSIEISPPNPILVTGTTLPVVITAVYSDGSTKDVSSSSTVTSSAAAYVSVSGTTLTGVHPGTATITATYQGKTATATVTVVDTTLQSISIQAVAPVPVGQTVNLVATGVFADGSKQDVTSQATWTSSDPTIAAVGDTATTKGQVTGVAAGTVTVTATIQTSTGPVSGTVQITVVAKKITSIGITPAQPILQKGVTQAFKATAVYDDNSTGDVTQQATWSTDDASVLSVVATGATAGLATAKAAGSTTITATVGAVSGQTSVRVTAPPLTSITVNPATATISVNTTRQFTAQGTYADGSTADLTDSVTWSTGLATIISVSNASGTRGLVTALAVGTDNVVASMSGIVGMATVTVSVIPLVSIAVTPNPLTLPQNLTLPLKATATYGDQSTQDVTTSATWTVVDSSVATVGNLGTAAGQVTGLKANSSTTVTATLSGKSGSATVNVIAPTLTSITVTPATATISAGDTQAFTATGTYQGSTVGVDITTQVTWSSSNIAVAQVSNAAGTNGVATGLTSPARGNTVTITAALNGVQGTATLTVTAPVLVAIMVRPATATIIVGDTQAYTVRGVYANGTTGALTGVSWSSSSTGVATIAAGGGGGATATGVGPGTTTITATYTTAGGTSLTDTATLTVNAVIVKTPIGIRLSPASATIQVNGTQPYTVNVDYSDGTTAAVAAGVTLTTSNPAVAAVAGGGRGGGGLLVNGVGPGTATITATYATGGQTFTDTATLTVTSIPPPPQVGLYITPSLASVNLNGTQQFQAHATFSDGTETVVTNTATCSWTTSDGSIATITTAGGGRGGFGGGGGLATGVAAGNVTINATYGGFSATAALTVTSPPVVKSLVILPATATIHVGQDQPFTATAFYSDGTSATVTGAATWSSSDATVAVMSVAGGGRGGFPGGGVLGGATATGLAIGTATVSASYTENGVTLTGTAVLTVTDPPLLSLEITPTNPTVSLLSPNQAFVATAIFTDYSTRNVTAAASWSSSDGTVAVVSNAGGTIGRATGLTVGTSTITATYGGMSASTILTVVSKKVTTIQVTPTNPTAVLGINQPFVATAVYDDNTTGAVTGASTWTSSDPTVASVGTAGGTAGVAMPTKAGTTTVTANYQGVSGTSVLTVSTAKLKSIAITPSPLSVVTGGHQQLTATGTWDDNSTRDITNNVTWLSSSGDAGGDAIATVSNAAGSRGLFTAVSAGAVTVTAAFQGVTGTLAGTVTASH
jgi:trimeric autotransporter adhesin